MKKYLFFAVAALALTACEKQVTDDLNITEETTGRHLVRFSIEGDFSSPTFTRGTVAANGKSMTDIWIFDYMDGALVAQYHQSSEDADFGTPEIPLDYGSHNVYFVASRGKTPAVSTTSHTISWTTTSDTFYKNLAINVTTGSASAQAVSLTRAATKLGITINDAIPEGISTVTITPAKWYYGIDYLTGAPADMQETPREIAIAESSVGKTGIELSIFGMSASTEWTTNVSVVARDTEDNILGQATITDAPFVANRATNYSGNLFESNSTFTVSLTDAWGDAHNATW